MMRGLILAIVTVLVSAIAGSCRTESGTTEEIRGVWVPGPHHTDVMHSYANLLDFVEMLDELNLNTVFVVSYANSQTLYPSQVLLDHSTYSGLDQSCMLTPYMDSYHQPRQSPTGDPVQDLIDLAHERNIKVYFWFEFGFMGDLQPMTPDHPIAGRHPEWMAMAADQTPARYNHDYYFNSYDPAVQDYLVDLILEALRLYPGVDGIQGDDRLPAAPRNSGYDPVTVARYQLEQDGNLPPADYNDQQWVRWRLDILNDFADRLHSEVKAFNPQIQVSFAPNPYPWCMENLMQEWPVWIAQNNCDLLTVQCYRRDTTSYKSTLLQTLEYLPAGFQGRFVPGMILMAGQEMLITAEVLRQQMRINRELHLKGEVFFYNEGLHNDSIKAVLREFYLP